MAETTFPLHHPDPELDQLARDALADLDALRAAVAAGATPDASRLLSGAMQEAAWQAVQKLCADGYLLHAASIAVLMASNLPGEARFQALAARILRHLGETEAAALFFARALAAGDDPVAAFRLGQCLADCNEPEAAMKVFHSALDTARGRDQWRALQDQVSLAIARLENSSPN